jgi:hypothetical protein
MLKRHAKDPVSEVTTIDELKDFFGDEGTNGAGKGTEEINPGGDVIIRAKPVRHKTTDTSLPIPDPEGEGGSGTGKGKGSGGNGGEGGGGGGGEGGSGGKGLEKKPLNKLSNVRLIIIGPHKRRIGFTPTNSGPALLRFMESGADTDYDVKITASDKGVIKDGRVEMTLQADTRCTVEIEMAENFTGSMRVLAYEI